MRNVFISIRVPGEHDQRFLLAETIKNAVIRSGSQPFVAYQEILRLGLASSQEFMPFVRRQLRLCSLVIVAYDSELRGGLIEAGLAYAWNIPIWVLHQTGIRVSSSILGCADQTIAYENLQHLDARLAAGLDAWNLTTIRENKP